MLLTYSANFVLWKFSAMRLSESYISHDAGMHTQLVAILKGIDTRSIYITSIDSFGTASPHCNTREHSPARFHRNV
jgi:hypothetical protein